MPNPAVHHLAASLDPNKVAPGLLGFLIVCVLGLATWFLVKSMSRQLGKLERDYAEQDAAEAEREAELGGAL
jgi:hypothetical protein